MLHNWVLVFEEVGILEGGGSQTKILIPVKSSFFSVIHPHTKEQLSEMFSQTKVLKQSNITYSIKTEWSYEGRCFVNDYV